MIKKNKLGFDVLKLLGGSGLAQIITMFTFVGLARFYDASHFGQLAILQGSASVVSSFLALRLEMTVLNTKTEMRANFAATICMCLSLALLAVVQAIAIFIVVAGADRLTLLVPIWAFCIGAEATVTLLLNRTKRYLTISLIAILKSLLIACFSFGAYVLEYSLVAGVFTATIATTIIYILLVSMKLTSGYRVLNYKKALCWLRMNKSFPILSLPAALVSNMSSQAPMFLFGYFYGSAAVGAYSLIQRFVMAPVSLIATAINSVFAREVAQRVTRNIKVLSLTNTTLKKTTFLSMLSVVVVYIFVNADGFTRMMGSQWFILDDLALFFLPALFFSFAAKCISRFAAFKKNGIGLLYQIFLLAIILTSLCLCGVLGISFNISILILSGTLAIANFVQIGLVLYVSQQHDHSVEARLNDQ